MYTFLSAFSGCGGADLGFSNEGFRCVGAFDIDTSCIQTYTENLSDLAVQVDLRNGIPSTFSTKNIDVFFAGSPCQGFSSMGKGDVNDPRNTLFIKAVEIALQVRPKVVVLENVAGILSEKFKRFHNAAIAMLRGAGYKVCPLKVQASEFGLPQIRKRAIIVAWNTEHELDLQLDGMTPVFCLADFLSGIHKGRDYLNDTLPLSDLDRTIAPFILPGKKLSNSRSGTASVHTWEIPEAFGSTSMQERRLLSAVLQLRRRDRVRDWGDADAVSLRRLNAYLGYDCRTQVARLVATGYLRRVNSMIDLRNTFNGKYRRISRSELIPAVDTRFGQAGSFLHPTRVGGFSVREAAALQGFPSSFRFAGDLRTQFRMIGNAVPVSVAEALARLSKRLLQT